MTLRFLLLTLLASAGLCVEQQAPLGQNHASVQFSSNWAILGPFQIGTREATWGADPLELFGGFRALSYSHNATFKSSLTTNGSAGWSQQCVQPKVTESSQSTAVTLRVGFPDVDWPFLQSIYGWAALQWQAWARGSIYVTQDGPHNYVLYTAGVLELWLDGEPYFGGDYYSFRRAPLVLRLAPGEHQIDVRLLRDVRVMGGVGEPVVAVELELRKAEAEIEVDEDRVIISDVVEGHLAGRYASVPVTATDYKDVDILGVELVDWSCTSTLDKKQLRLRASQTRPIVFSLSCPNEVPPILTMLILYNVDGGSTISKYTFKHKMNFKSNRDVHRFTFLHAGIVSYAMLRPPQHQSLTSDHIQAKQLPILLNLHGAGLEADNPQLTRSLDAVSDLPVWTLFPTGGSPWSGDDWHIWGWADVDAAVNSLPGWIRNTNWQGPSIDISKWLVAGHSNGGQGVWHALTHRPDNIIGAVAISGYLSIQKYVPSSLWHEADPARTAIVQASLADHRHELLISNAKGIPIMQEHGDTDDNVPVYHSRRMSQLINETSWRSNYFEVGGEGHWFGGIMETEPLRQFYEEVLTNSKEAEDELSFTLTSANPGKTGSKHGFDIESLIDPGKLGKLEVCLEAGRLNLCTSNIESVLLSSKHVQNMNIAVVDGQILDMSDAVKSARLIRTMPHGKWQLEATSYYRRSRKQFGRLDAILSSDDSFRIKSNSDAGQALALQISRNLFQYFGADSDIMDQNGAYEGKGNIISVVEGQNVWAGHFQHHPIEIVNGSICVRGDDGIVKRYSADTDSAIFLRPLPEERLELVIWGGNKSSLARAGRMLPMLPGVGQPDFIILSQESAWKGVEGVLTMGFFDSQWNVTRSSFFS